MGSTAARKAGVNSTSLDARTAKLAAAREAETSPTGGALQAVRVQALMSFRAFLSSKTTSPEDEGTFMLIVREAIERHGFSANMFVEKFGVHPSTPGRWAAGQSYPQPYVRPTIVNWVLQQVVNQIRDARCSPQQVRNIDQLVREQMRELDTILGANSKTA